MPLVALALGACSTFVAETAPSWARPGLAVRCDDTSRWAYADAAAAAAGGFLLANADGKGIDTYVGTASILVFGVSAVIGFLHGRECRCLHQAWLDQARRR